MLTPRSFNRLIHYFDGVDREVSNKLIRTRPHLEPGLTMLLADLIDPSTAGEYRLPYSQEALHADVACGGGALGVDLKLELNEYAPEFENRVTQADLGLVLRYVDHVRPAESWEKPFLLQAKRLTPNLRGQSQYTAASRFDLDAEQSARIKRLRGVLGDGAIRFLLYCPRPDRLDAKDRAVLEYFRTRALAGDFFDFIEGLEIREQLGADNSTLEAGVFVRDGSTEPTTLAELHHSLMTKSIPLSWFIAVEFADVAQGPGLRLGRAFHPRPRGAFVPTIPAATVQEDGDPDFLMGVLKARPDAVRRLLAAVDHRDHGLAEAQRLAQGVLPRHTMTISVHAARGANPDLLSQGDLVQAMRRP